MGSLSFLLQCGFTKVFPVIKQQNIPSISQPLYVPKALAATAKSSWPSSRMHLSSPYLFPSYCFSSLWPQLLQPPLRRFPQLLLVPLLQRILHPATVERGLQCNPDPFPPSASLSSGWPRPLPGFHMGLAQDLLSASKLGQALPSPGRCAPLTAHAPHDRRLLVHQGLTEGHFPRETLFTSHPTITLALSVQLMSFPRSYYHLKLSTYLLAHCLSHRSRM